MDSLINHIRTVYKSMGYAFFEKGNLNLNIGGIRSKNRKANKFDDLRFAVYKKRDVWRIDIWPQTTDPGLIGLRKPCRPEGCAILVPGQYRGAYKWGLHKGKRIALVQHKPVSVFRDWNKDDLLDFDPSSIMTGMFGINIHDPWRDGEEVNGRSLGCQVARHKVEHTKFMDLCTVASKKWGDIFTYTLFSEEDFGL